MSTEEMNQEITMAEAMQQEAEKLDNIQVGSVVDGTVVSVDHNGAMVDIGYKQDILVPNRELAYPAPESAEDVVKVNDVIKVYIQSLGGENGGALSKVKADRMKGWEELEKLKDADSTVQATVTQVVKGGLVASVGEYNVRGFIPASQVELHFVKDLSQFVGQTFECKIIEIDVHKQRLVLSRRELLQAERAKAEEQIFATLEPGTTVKGVVKRIVDYGAFIDIGGVDGLAHISDLAWHRVKNVDKESRRISLSVKDTMPDPWYEHASHYEEGQVINGKIIKLTDFGAFMEIEQGFDGLIPMGELADHRIERADEAVHTGDEVTVKILRIDTKRKRISLSITKANK